MYLGLGMGTKQQTGENFINRNIVILIPIEILLGWPSKWERSGWVLGTRGGSEKYIQGFDGNTLKKDATWKT